MPHQRYYLNDIPMNEAIDKFNAALEQKLGISKSPSEIISLDQATNRVTAEPVWAKISSPHYDAAAMDGVAVKANDTVGATETSPIKLKLSDQAVWVNTGDPIPQEFDAVIMMEVIHKIDDATIEIKSPVAPYQYIRPLGEDIVATELVLLENHRIRPVDVGACAAAGLVNISVRKRPQVIIIPTGDELVPLGKAQNPGDIIEFNSLVLSGLFEEWGTEVTVLEAIPDNYSQLRTTINNVINEYDIVVINAGSSAGSEDYTAPLIEELGEVVVHGAAIRPGHPIVLGIVKNKPVFGIPGYPVSAVLTSEIFVRPLIDSKLGTPTPIKNTVQATISRKVLSPIGEDEFLRVKLGSVGNKIVATPMQRGAGVIMSLVRADGIVRIPRFSEGFDVGKCVTVELLKPIDEIRNTIVTIGSHDLTLDLLANQIRRHNPKLTLSSSNVGSLGGLISLGRGESHLSGSHLLDEQTGEYNLTFINRYLSDVDVVVINLVQRIQGLIVPKDNPKNITDLEDLSRDDVTFINRQRGSGTRILLDYKIKQNHMDSRKIKGYSREAFTHLAISAAVAGGQADVGLGIFSAAKAMDNDFVPVMKEQYDLVIPKIFYEDKLLEPLISVIHSQEFKNEVEALGGYDVSTMGNIVTQRSNC